MFPTHVRTLGVALCLLLSGTALADDNAGQTVHVVVESINAISVDVSDLHLVADFIPVGYNHTILSLDEAVDALPPTLTVSWTTNQTGKKITINVSQTPEHGVLRTYVPCDGAGRFLPGERDFICGLEPGTGTFGVKLLPVALVTRSPGTDTFDLIFTLTDG